MKHELQAFLRDFNSFSQDEIQAIMDNTIVVEYPKGSVLLNEGEITSQCYFILKGCVREYQLSEGSEKTTAFFTENHAVISYRSYLHKTPSVYSYGCVEDCHLIVATRERELALHKQFPRLEFVTQTLMQNDFHQVQERLATMVSLSPEARYEHLIETRPDLLLRVPLHYIASFLGVTPESFSRIRKRVSGKRS